MNHFVWSYDYATATPSLYVNSVSQGSLSIDGGGSYSNYNSTGILEVYVAAQTGGTQELQGRLSQLSIWSGSLDSSQASELYNDGRPKDLYEPKPKKVASVYKDKETFYPQL